MIRWKLIPKDVLISFRRMAEWSDSTYNNISSLYAEKVLIKKMVAFQTISY